MEIDTLRAFTVSLIANILLTMVVVAPAWSQQSNSNAPRPGNINDIEGQASVDTESLGPNSAGSVDLANDQSLTTQAGKVEVLLSPSFF